MNTVPRTRRSFASRLDELGYLADKIRYWLHLRRDRSAALRFRERFRKLLKASTHQLRGSIVLEAYLALLYDLDGDIEREIAHRERQVDLLRRLLEIGGAVDQYDHEELAEQLCVLGSLWFDQQRPHDARRCLTEAQELSRQHRFPFHENDLLREVLAECERLKAVS